jgi:hypothetical protein
MPVHHRRELVDALEAFSQAGDEPPVATPVPDANNTGWV